MKKILLFLFIIVSIFSCKKKESACPVFWGYLLPHSLAFIIKNSGQRLPDSILNNLKLSYYNMGIKKYISDFSRGTNEQEIKGYDLGIMGTRDIGFKSADNNIKNYYIEYPNGNIDTLFVDYRHYSACEADTSSCGCSYPMYVVKYNDKNVVLDTAITVLPVYIFNK